MLKAILFDLDGTLANTDPIHYAVWQEILQNHGTEINHEFYKTHISGRQNESIIQDLFPQLSENEGQKLADDKESRFRERAVDLKPLAGLSDVLTWVQRHQLKTAVVTNAPRANAEFMLNTLNLRECFNILVLAEDVIAGKPDPAPYQYGLKQLEVQPEEAIVFEDSPAGIRSAIQTGIETIGVASTHEPEHLQDLGVGMVIEDFHNPKLWQRLESSLCYQLKA